jgi:hypothetical protein
MKIAERLASGIRFTIGFGLEVHFKNLVRIRDHPRHPRGKAKGGRP